MRILGRQISGKLVAALALAMIVAALLPVMTQSRVDREINLVVRDMTFYVDGDTDRPNPVLTLRRGERVRIVLTNDERGMTHDFAVPAFGAATSLVNWNEQDDVVVTAPDEPGTYEYVCNPHRLMMKGTLTVY
jgi:plastocyanin